MDRTMLIQSLTLFLNSFDVVEYSLVEESVYAGPGLWLRADVTTGENMWETVEEHWQEGTSIGEIIARMEAKIKNIKEKRM